DGVLRARYARAGAAVRGAGAAGVSLSGVWPLDGCFQILHGLGMTLILRPQGRLMGQVTTWITVGGIFEAGREMQCKALVDTGAYCLTLPAAWRDRFGALPMSEPVGVEMADGRVERGEVCGQLRLRVGAFSAVAGKALLL